MTPTEKAIHWPMTMVRWNLVSQGAGEGSIRERLPLSRMSTRKRVWIVTGGIGSGKSAVRRILEQRSFTGIDSDAIGHAVLEQDGPAYEAVVGEWPAVVGEDGSIDRRRLGRIVFADGDELKRLEQLTHPHIFDRITSRVQENRGDDYAIEIPVMKKVMDESLVVVVDAPDAVRLARIVERGMTEAEGRARMASQPSRAAWLAFGDAVVPNKGLFEDLESTVVQLLGIE